MSCRGEPFKVGGGVLVGRAPGAERGVTIAREVRLTVSANKDDAVFRGHAVNVASIMLAFDPASSVDVNLVSGLPAHGVDLESTFDFLVLPYARSVSKFAQDLLGLAGQGFGGGNQVLGTRMLLHVTVRLHQEIPDLLEPVRGEVQHPHGQLLVLRTLAAFFLEEAAYPFASVHHDSGTTVPLVHVGMGLQPQNPGYFFHPIYMVAIDNYSLSFSFLQASLGSVVNAEQSERPYLLLLVEPDGWDRSGSGAIVLAGVVRQPLREIETRYLY